MTNEELFDIWAPAAATWSVWAKPVLFAQRRPTLAVTVASEDWAAAETSWVPPADEQLAVVIDLPGRDSVLAGLALAARGYRPVPLYNACNGPLAVVPMGPIVELIEQAATYLERLVIPPDAPPAFLLDADRLRCRAPPGPGHFDNRWMTFPQDFPSANFLLAQAIQSVLLVQAQPNQPQEDLAHVLLRWQEGGLRLRVVSPGAGNVPQPIEVRRPHLFRWAWHRALVTLGLRRNSAGGFGAVVPQPSSG